MAQHPSESDGRLPVLFLRRPAQLKALSHPTRVKVLELLIEASMTSKQLGDALGMSAARVHYHLKFLERAGLVRLVNRCERAGVVEKYYRATSRKYLVSQAIGMFGNPGAVILESLAEAILAGAESAAGGKSIGLLYGANERVRVPSDRLSGLLAVANALQAAQEELRAVATVESNFSGAGGAPSFELTFALYVAGNGTGGDDGGAAQTGRSPGPGKVEGAS